MFLTVLYKSAMTSSGYCPRLRGSQVLMLSPLAYVRSSIPGYTLRRIFRLLTVRYCCHVTTSFAYRLLVHFQRDSPVQRGLERHQGQHTAAQVG